MDHPCFEASCPILKKPPFRPGTVAWGEDPTIQLSGLLASVGGESPRDAIPCNNNDKKRNTQSSREHQAEDKKVYASHGFKRIFCAHKATMKGYEMSPGCRRVESKARIAPTRAILNLGVRNRVRT